MNRFKKGILFATLFIGLVAVGCSNDDDDDLIGNWIKKYDSFLIRSKLNLSVELLFMIYI